MVKRILIVTAELERQDPGKRALTNQLLELGLFGVPVLALAPAIYLVRRGGRNSEHPEPSEVSNPAPMTVSRAMTPCCPERPLTTLADPR